MINKGIMSSNTDMWETPQWIFDTFNVHYLFTLDVCAVQDNAKCKNYFTLEQDGLKQKWEEMCWMNPPYGREIIKWVRKAYESSLDGTVVVALLPARTDTAWFWDYVYEKAMIGFIRGRLRFGDGKGAAPFPSMIAVWDYPVTTEGIYRFELACRDMRDHHA
jgi:phage N-6-adenine-methyltransferase